MYGEENLIIAGDSQEHLIKKGGNTSDIVAAIMQADEISIAYVEDFAHSLQGNDIAETCANIYNWVRNTIPYHEDPQGMQGIQLPGQLYLNRKQSLGGTGFGGDCKSMSLFCSSVLRALGNYNFKYRFISENRNENFHHVYLIVDATESAGEPCYIPLDCTLSNFAVEVPYAKKLDKKPHVPVEEKIGGLFDGTPANTYRESYWQTSVAEMKQNYNTRHSVLRMRCFADIAVAYAKQHPIRFSEFEKELLKHYNEFITLGSCLIYYYWNRKDFIAYNACRGVGATSFADIPFPTEYAQKRQTAQDFRNGLITLGLKDEHIRELADLGTFQKYGVPMDYMLYRCYCIQLYGQPFAPHPGVPYWNSAQNAMIPNAVEASDQQAQLKMSLQIITCFPAQGGIGRPFGQPYWSTGGWIINNGGSDADCKAFEASHKRPGFKYADGTKEPGVILNNGEGVTWDKQLECLAVYNLWCKGNLVCLPQPIYNPDVAMLSGSSIGYLPIAEIVAIVVAIATALATVATIIAKLVESFKSPSGASAIPLPLQDFHWDYQTADGCMIGHCVDPSGCNGATTAKMCGGKIVEVNPNRNDPKNQPPDPGNFFTGNPTNKKILGGVGIAAAGLGLLMLNSNNN